MEPVFLGLGSNLGQRRARLQEALDRLSRREIALQAVSSWYQSEPVGETSQPAFINGVCRIATPLQPQALLEVCLSIEQAMGRVRSMRWGPRNIDIDLLFFGSLIVHQPELTLPHPELHKRRFVLLPLCELAPDFEDPSSGLTIRQLLARCPDRSRVGRLGRPDPETSTGRNCT